MNATLIPSQRKRKPEPRAKLLLSVTPERHALMMRPAVKRRIVFMPLDDLGLCGGLLFGLRTMARLSWSFGAAEKSPVVAIA